MRPKQARHPRKISERVTFYENHTRCVITVPESYLFHSLGLALSEKQMDLLEQDAALRRQTLSMQLSFGCQSLTP